MVGDRLALAMRMSFSPATEQSHDREKQDKYDEMLPYDMCDK